MKIISLTALLITLAGNAFAQALPVSSKPDLLTFADNLQNYIKSKTDNTCKFDNSEEPFCTVTPKKTYNNLSRLCEALKITIKANCGDGDKDIQFGWEVRYGLPVTMVDGADISLDGENLPTPVNPLSKYLQATEVKNNPWFVWALRLAKEHLNLKEKD